VTNRVVLDTNIVLSALLFRAGRLAWMRHAWQGEQLRPLVCQETARELIRVLSYPKFKLSTEEQKDLLGDFLPYAEVVTLPAAWPQLPHCRDEKDRIFLALAKVSDADALVTGDADLLVLRDQFSKPIWTAEELAARMKG
jgi:putative PIN family toxin of toxin-antitoxin system